MIVDTTAAVGPVDAGNLAFRVVTNGRTIIGLQTAIPLPVVVFKRHRVAKLIGPTARIVPLDLTDDHVTFMFQVPHDMVVFRANINGVHVDVTGSGTKQYISGTHLPCSLPAFKLFYKDTDEASAEPQIGIVEVKPAA